MLFKGVSLMAKSKFTTTIEEDILKEMKIQAVKEDLNVGEIIEKAFSFYMQSEKRYIKENQHKSFYSSYVSSDDLKDLIQLSIREIMEKYNTDTSRKTILGEAKSDTQEK